MEKLYDHGFSGQAGYTENKLITEAYEKVLKINEIRNKKLQGIKDVSSSRNKEEEELEMYHDEKMLQNIMREKDFIGIYGADKVKKDEKDVFNQEKIIERDTDPQRLEDKKRSTVIEEIIFEQSVMADWLGEKTNVIKTAKYDDYFNHIDLVAEFDNSEKNISNFINAGMAIDVTFSQDLDRKIARNKKEIDAGVLAEIEYIRSKNIKPGKLKNIPRFLIVLDRKTTDELIEIYLNGEKKELNYHPVQNEIIGSIELQAAIYGYNCHRDKEKIYRGHKDIAKKILAEKNQKTARMTNGIKLLIQRLSQKFDIPEL